MNSFIYNIIICLNYCIIQNSLIKIVVFVAKKEGGLYRLNQLSFAPTEIHTCLYDVLNIAPFLKPFVNIILSINAINKESLHQYVMFAVDMHDRLGHASIGKLKQIKGLDIKDTSTTNYRICPLAKQSRLPFLLSNSIAQKPFDLIHVDIWGPYKKASITGAKYFLTIIDDHTRVAWTFMMHLKGQL